jgi:hypothetical protein
MIDRLDAQVGRTVQVQTTDRPLQGASLAAASSRSSCAHKLRHSLAMYRKWFCLPRLECVVRTTRAT